VGAPDVYSDKFDALIRDVPDDQVLRIMRGYWNAVLPQWRWPMMRKGNIESMLRERGLGDPLIDQILDQVQPFERRTYVQKHHYYDLRTLAGKVPKRRIGRIRYAPLEPIGENFIKAVKEVKQQADVLEQRLNSVARSSGIAVETIAQLEGYRSDTYERLAMNHTTFRCANCRTEFCAVRRVEFKPYYGERREAWGDYVYLRRWDRDEADELYIMLPVCSEGCEAHLTRIVNFIEERKEREWQTIKRG
jgi:hypothetical protein